MQEEVLSEANEAKDSASKLVTEFKSNRLFFILGGFFLANALIAEFIGVKIFALEPTLGIENLRDSPLNFTAGVLLWPVVFVMTDVINEYFGVNGVRFLSFIVAGLIAYAFVAVFLAIGLEPAAWWVGAYESQGVENMQNAFAAVFGQGLWIIVASLVAFLVGQLVDAVVFRRVKMITGNNRIWLRATISTLVSQFIDSYLVLYIAFVIGADWTMEMFWSIGTVNYIYKVVVAILLIPFLYFVHSLIDNYLGEDVSNELKELALDKN